MGLDNRYYFWTQKCTVWVSVDILNPLTGCMTSTFIPLDDYRNIACHLSFSKSPPSSQDMVVQTTQLVRLFVLFPNGFIPEPGTFIEVDRIIYKCSGAVSIYKSHIEINLLRSHLSMDQLKGGFSNYGSKHC